MLIAAVPACASVMAWFLADPNIPESIRLVIAAGASVAVCLFVWRS